MIDILPRLRKLLDLFVRGYGVQPFSLHARILLLSMGAAVIIFVSLVCSFSSFCLFNEHKLLMKAAPTGLLLQGVFANGRKCGLQQPQYEVGIWRRC